MIVEYRVFIEDNGQFTFREVFYQQDGKLIAYSQSPIMPRAGSLEELSEELILLKEALEQPALSLAIIEAEITSHSSPTPRRRKTISHEDLVKKLGLDRDDEPLTEEPVLAGTSR